MSSDGPNFSDPSREVLDPSVWEVYLRDPHWPALVSFPRTGSHWLRMLLELSTGVPSLKRQFFYFNPDRYLFWHTHDDDLNFQCRRVIYLQRDPIDTVYSQLQYVRDSGDDANAVLACSAQYLAHLRKWLGQPEGVDSLLEISYQELLRDPSSCVRKVVDFLDEPWSDERFALARARVTKEVVRLKTATSDDRVISLKDDYAAGRERFRQRFAVKIRQQFVQADPSLERIFV